MDYFNQYLERAAYKNGRLVDHNDFMRFEFIYDFDKNEAFVRQSGSEKVRSLKQYRRDHRILTLFYKILFPETEWPTDFKQINTKKLYIKIISKIKRDYAPDKEPMDIIQDVNKFERNTE